MKMGTVRYYDPETDTLSSEILFEGTDDECEAWALRNATETVDWFYFNSQIVVLD